MAFGLKPYTSPFSQYLPKPQAQPISSTAPKPQTWSWANQSQNGGAVNTQPWDPQGIFSGTGMTSTTPTQSVMTMGAGPAPAPNPVWEPTNPMSNMTMAAGPTASPNPVWEPAPVDNMTMGAGPSPSPDPVAGGQPTGGQSPNFQFTMEDLMAYMGETAMPTMDQIQMDPSYQFQLEEGQRALMGRMAARGLGNSTEADKGLLDYSQGLASMEYGKAYDRFRGNRQDKANQLGSAWQMLSGDRQFGAGRYDTGWNQNFQQGRANQSDYQYANDTGYKQYLDMMNDYNSRMGSSRGADAGLGSTGFSSAQEAAQTITSSASALAQLGMSSAQIEAMRGMASRGQNMDMVQFLVGLATKVVTGGLVG